MFKIAIICGGPSEERGVSLNSARSLYDHLASEQTAFVVLYVDQALNFYQIQEGQLYSNTPSDFNFVLARTGKALEPQQYIDLLKGCDIAFPCIHGQFGEDGQLQQIFEANDIPFVGSSAQSCQQALNKFNINQHLAAHGYPTLPISQIHLQQPSWQRAIRTFFDENGGDDIKVIVKPNAGGSSLGVKVVNHYKDAIAHATQQATRFHETLLVVESFCAGKEFTVVVLQNAAKQAVALPPTEVIMDKGADDEVFDFRRKYLATSNTKRPCPPESFSEAQILQITSQAEAIFDLFAMRDMVRIDGFLMADGTLYFTDLNPVSGMEQNSFIFQQASRIGWTHRDLLSHIVNCALSRYGNLRLPQPSVTQDEKHPVWVLFGGDTAEKEVSVMSGSNIWMKLLRSNQYQPTPHLLTKGQQVWQLPYAFCLDHTVSEIDQNCQQAQAQAPLVNGLAKVIRSRLGLVDDWGWDVPQAMDLDTFFQRAKQAGAFIFLGLHGGAGEDGTLQRMMDGYGLKYNGPGAECSALCMDKYKTGQVINAANIPDLIAAPKRIIGYQEGKGYSLADCEQLWQQTVTEFAVAELIIKPLYDGCSYGIVHLQSGAELKTYFDLLGRGQAAAPNTFVYHKGIVEMDFNPEAGLLLEPFITTVKLVVAGSSILPLQVEGWIELTVGVISTTAGLQVMSPSITVAQGSVLALEEKFQSGTGVNLTPPIETIVSKPQTQLIQAKVKQAAELLGISGYSRIDVFFNTVTNQVMVIEANTLPGLTPSTVIYHQALAEDPSMPPTQFLEHLIRTREAVR